MLKPICVIEARDLDDAWFQTLAACMQTTDSEYDYSVRYKIQRGSYQGQERLEIDLAVIDIKYPGLGPLIPQMPVGKEHLAPTTTDYVCEYVRYLLTNTKQQNELYTYGERIVGVLKEDVKLSNQLDSIINMYKHDGHNTNQATIEIAQPSDVFLSDPPCLRLIDTRIRQGVLHFIVYFRSWDLYNGFPVNLAGLQQLKKYMASEIGVGDGAIRAISKGLHLYDDMWDFAHDRLGSKHAY